MANESNISLLDHLSRTDPSGKIMPIVEPLSKECPVLADALWKEGNLPTGHLYTTRTALPSVSYRRFNKGDDPTKSRTAQIVETCGRFGTRSKVDAKQANFNGNAAAFRMTEDVGHVEAMIQNFERAFFYDSDKDEAERMYGLFPRLDDLDGPHSDQIIEHDVGATGQDQASIAFVTWGERKVFCMYPKGSKAGWDYQDLGQQLTADGDGKEYLAYVADWDWQCGVVVEDYRAVARVCNIDVTNLSKTNDTLTPKMIEAFWRLHKPNAGKTIVYMPRTIAEYLEHQTRAGVKNASITYETFAGKQVLAFKGYPIHISDELLVTESPVA